MNLSTCPPRCPLVLILGTAMPDREACRGRDSNGCPFGAIRQVNRTNKRSGTTYYKRLCFQCNAGKRPASRSPSPQRRPPVHRAHRAQNCFGGDASAVSHRQVGRGRAPEGTSWTGSQHEFDNPTSADATAYTTQRNGGSRKYHCSTERQQKARRLRLALLHSRYDAARERQVHLGPVPRGRVPRCCQCSRLVCELCRDSQDNEWYVHWTKAKNRNSK